MEYDNTNQGAAHPPFETQQLILTGKLDVEGDNKQVAIVKDTDKNGEAILVVYQRIGCMYANADATAENKQPAYSGPQDGNRRLAAWRAISKDGNNFLSLKTQEKYANGTSPQPAAVAAQPVIAANDVPF